MASGQSVAKPSNSSESGQAAAQRDNAASNNHGSNIASPVKQAATKQEAATTHSKAQTKQPDPYAFRNMRAQEDMAYWSMWMVVAALLTFIVTSIGTFLIWRQVRLTREAVEDTSKATEAMTEANQIAKDAQRPWLKVECELLQAEIEEDTDVLSLRYRAVITNLGKMVAERCAIRGSLVERDDTPAGQRAIDNSRKEAERITQITEENSAIKPYPILPGERTEVRGWIERSGDFSGLELSGKPEAAILLIFVAVRYHIPGETVTRMTDRAFRIDYIPDGADEDDVAGIPLPIPSDFSLERLRLRRSGHNRTT